MSRRLRGIGATVLFVAASVSSPAAISADAPRLVSVQAVAPRPSQAAPDLALTGAIQARIQTNVAFRVNGKVTTRRVEVGQHVGPDDVLATLDPAEQQADVTNADAALASAAALRQQAQQTFDRQKSLIESGYTTRASFDQAQESLNTTTAQVRAAQAELNTAREQLAYADLRSGQPGVIVSRNVEAGQVVQAGQTVFVLAQDGPRDAVFDIPEALLTSPPKDKKVDVALQSDLAVRTTGTVREISPILDASTSTVMVKIGLDDTPPGMALGAAVVGRAHWELTKSYTLPWSALFESGGRPAVWVLDDHDVVALKPISVQSYGTGSFTVASGLDEAQRVVTAGVQLLYPGQRVAVVGGVAP